MRNRLYLLTAFLGTLILGVVSCFQKNGFFKKNTTPLQVLVMMNDPTVLEASRVLAQRLMQQKSPAQETITKAFRRIVCRKPTEKETAILRGYFDGQAALFKQNKLNASKVLDVGEYPPAKIADRAAWAALMQVIETIYNMEETITKT